MKKGLDQGTIMIFVFVIVALVCAIIIIKFNSNATDTASSCKGVNELLKTVFYGPLGIPAGGC